MDSAILEQALFDAAGETVPVTRIELEPLAGGRCRWILWSSGRRIHTATALARDVPAMLEATRLLIASNAARP
jgi:hypothetical protein